MKTSRSKRASVESDAWHRLGPIDVLLLSAWCGLAAGELEVGARVISKSLSSTDRLYQMTRHFVWLVPLIDLVLFLGFGFLLGGRDEAMAASSRLAEPAAHLRLGGPSGAPGGRTRDLHGSVVDLRARDRVLRLSGVRAESGRHAPVAAWSLPVLLSAVVIQASLIFGGDWLKQWREEGRPLPPPGSPNVLFIVLDTVRADHLSVYGYERPTSPNLERLAARSIRFEQARAAAPWTLASHASMFTGALAA